MKQPDVGFIGLAGAGKDTAALALTCRGWRRKAFADYLKIMAVSFGWDGYKDERGRRLLQDLGMAARKYNPNFWIDQAYYGLNSMFVDLEKVPYAWTDIRFQNEAEFVRRRGGIIIRIIRPSLESIDDHVSEREQLEIVPDYIVVNDGTEQELHNTITRILNI